MRHSAQLDALAPSVMDALVFGHTCTDLESIPGSWTVIAPSGMKKQRAHPVSPESETRCQTARLAILD